MNTSGAPATGAPASTQAKAGGAKAARPSVASAKRARVSQQQVSSEPVVATAAAAGPTGPTAVAGATDATGRGATTAAIGAAAVSAATVSRTAEAQLQPAQGMGQPNNARAEAGAEAAAAATGRPSVGQRPQVRVIRGAGGEGSSEADEATLTPQAPKRRLPVAIWIILGVFLVLVGVVTAFCCLRWVFPQDQQDIQGTWAMRNAANEIVITADKVDLAGSASYGYILDTQAKTIETSFLNKSGCSHYRFSRERDSIAIIEGESTDWVATTMQDLAWMWEDFIAACNGQSSDPLGSSKGVVLYRQQ